MTTNRREFLKTSAVASGVAVLGMYVPGMGGNEAKAAGSLHTPNVWVHIADDNSITLLSHMSEMGQGVHTALPMLIAEELNVDINSVKVATAPANPAYVNGLLGAQITGGSTSIRDAWEKLRVGGAQVRTMLVEAAASKWGVDASTLTANNGVVSGGGKSATYGELASAAAALPVPKDVKIKDPSQFRVVGKPANRLDTPAKVNGTAEFGIDARVPGMVYASIEQTPVIGGKPVSFDGTKAKAMPGVIDVVQIADGVAVVADTYWHAYNARKKGLTVKFEDGAVGGMSSAGMWAAIKSAEKDIKAIKIRPDVGDAAGAIAGATKVVKANYTTAMMAHQPLEPMNMIADVKGDKCDLTGPTQFQQGAQGTAAAVLGIKPENVTVRTTYLGGGFGRRIELDFISQAVQVSKAVGRPVKVLWSREDDMKHDFYRPQGLQRMEAGLDESGKPVGVKFQMTSQSITQRAFGLPKNTLDPFMVEAAVAPYDVPNTSHDLVIHDAGLRVGYLRAVSHTMNCFANECFMDELANAAKQDPVEYRLSLLKDARYSNVLKLAAEKAGWGKKLPKGRALGVALMEGYGTYMAQVAEVSVTGGNVKVHKVTVACDPGRMVNPEIVRQQLESGIVYGLSGALYGEITVKDGQIQQNNFNDFRVIRQNESPVIDIVLVESNEKPGGVGEPSTSLIGAAVGNAIFTATGKRVRDFPLASHLKKA